MLGWGIYGYSCFFINLSKLEKVKFFLKKYIYKSKRNKKYYMLKIYVVLGKNYY